MTAARKNILMLSATALIMAFPLFMVHGSFKGSDDQGTEAIEATGYQPWFKPIWTPPSDEVESLLFALQAALGAGVLGYVIGRRHQANRQDTNQADRDHVAR